LDKRLIVCADDFGLTLGVNNGIVDCYKNGILRSASLLANGPELDHAVELSREQPGLDLGIHLSLNDFAPVCPEIMQDLLDGRGFFFSSYLKVIKKTCLIPGLGRRIRGEFRCQIEKILEKGVAPSHINSHKHLHLFPPLWKIVSGLAREYDIPYVRYPVERIENLSWLLKHKGNRKFGRKLLFFGAFFLFFTLWHSHGTSRSRKVVKSPDYFCGLYATGFLNEAVVSDLIKSMRPGLTELMCHPGYLDDDLKQCPTRLLHSRENEIAALCSARVKQAVKDCKVEVTSFYECR